MLKQRLSNLLDFFLKLDWQEFQLIQRQTSGMRLKKKQKGNFSANVESDLEVEESNLFLSLLLVNIS